MYLLDIDTDCEMLLFNNRKRRDFNSQDYAHYIIFKGRMHGYESHSITHFTGSEIVCMVIL